MNILARALLGSKGVARGIFPNGIGPLFGQMSSKDMLFGYLIHAANRCKTRVGFTGCGKTPSHALCNRARLISLF
jgi:hypothetical protein